MKNPQIANLRVFFIDGLFDESKGFLQPILGAGILS